MPAAELPAFFRLKACLHTRTTQGRSNVYLAIVPSSNLLRGRSHEQHRHR
jgi:hypothetical protein